MIFVDKEEGYYKTGDCPYFYLYKATKEIIDALYALIGTITIVAECFSSWKMIKASIN